MSCKFLVFGITKNSQCVLNTWEGIYWRFVYTNIAKRSLMKEY